MRAMTYTTLGDPQGVELQERDQPHPGPGEAVVAMEAAGINYHDFRMLVGGSSWLNEEDLPYVSGADLAGAVEEIGDGVTEVEPGDRVVLSPLETCGSCRFCRDGPENKCEEMGVFHGSFAEFVTVEADRLVQLPQSVTMVQAAALPVAYMTAWHMIREARATAGDLVLVPGATGGVGVAAVQLLDVLGAESIATTTSESKLPRLEELGAAHAIQVESPAELEEKVSMIGLVDSGLNHLGGEYVNAALSTLRTGGRMVVCGRTTGEIAEINLRKHYRNNRVLIGSTIGTQADLERLVRLTELGSLDPEIDQVYSLDELGDAFKRLDERAHVGKLVLQS